MKRSLLGVAALVVLTACAAYPSEASVSEETAPATAAVSAAPDPTEPPGATPAPTPTPSPVPEETVFQRYIETFSAPEETVETTVTANGCTLTLEDSLDTEPELLVYQSYLYEAEGDWDRLSPLMDGDTTLAHTAELAAKQYRDGEAGMESQTIHELHVMTLEEVQGASDYSRKELQQVLADYDLQQWTMVAVDLSWTYTPEKEAAGPQLPEGRYQRYYLLGIPSGAGDWKLYQVYWEDFYPQS